MVFSPKIMKTALNVLQGVANPANYQVIITPPSAMLSAGALLGIGGSALSITGAGNVSIMAEKAMLPGRQIATQDFRMYGTVSKMPYGAVYDAVSIQFICSNLMTERLFFDTWQTFIMNPSRQYMHYYDTYVGTVIIAKLADDEATSTASAAAANYMLLQAYPISVQSQEVSYESEDSYLSLTVNFAYRRWTTLAEQAVRAAIGASPSGGFGGGSFGTGSPQETENILGGITDIIGG